jgi:hypothetical protein
VLPASAPSATEVAPTSGAPSAAAPLPTATSPVVLPSLPAVFSQHADPALEAQLPASVSGTVMQRYSLSVATVLDAGGNRAAIDALLGGIGKSEADASLAAASDPTDTVAGGVVAFKVSGADASTLLAGIVSVDKSDWAAAQPRRREQSAGKE